MLTRQAAGTEPAREQGHTTGGSGGASCRWRGSQKCPESKGQGQGGPLTSSLAWNKYSFPSCKLVGGRSHRQAELGPGGLGFQPLGHPWKRPLEVAGTFSLQQA